MPVTRAALAVLLPHAGAMSLLDEVERYDAETIVCRAVNHRDLSHPLREDGMLHAVCGIEYAAQAMAVHGALCDAGGARSGMLAAVRDVALHVERLDDVEGDLEVSARRVLAAGERLVYDFDVSARGRMLLEGRAIVVLSSAKPR